MFNIIFQNKFKKDYKLAIKRGLNINQLERVLFLLRENGKLPSKYKPHILKGNFENYWECHIQPDWLLIWKLDSKNNIITLTRTGTHSDLF